MFPNQAVVLALALYRDPLSVRGRVQAAAELPDGMTELLRIAGAELDDLRPQAEACGVDVGDLREASRFFIQQVLLVPGATYYRALGVESGADIAVIRSHHRLLMRLFHPDRHVGSECWTDAYAARINRAYNTLRNQASRQEYDQLPASGVRSERVIVAEEPFVPVANSTAWRPTEVSAGRGVAPRFNRYTPQMVLLGTVALAAVFVTVVYLNNRDMTVELKSPPGQQRSSALAVGDAGGLLPEAGGARVDQHPHDEDLGARLDSLPDVLPSKTTGGLGRSVDSGSSPVASQDGVGQASSAAIAATIGGQVAMSGQAVATQASSGELARQVGPRDTVSSLPAEQAAPPDLADKSALAAAGRQLVGYHQPRPSRVAKPPFSQATNGETVPLRSEKPRQRPAPLERGQLASSGAAPVVTIVSGGTSVRAFSEAELMVLTGSLVESYQGGHLDAFMGLFSKDARTTDEVGADKIRTEYRDLFDETDARKMAISSLVWQQQGQTSAGVGRIELVILRDGQEQHFRGKIIIEVARQHEQLVIVGLYYRLDRS